MKIKNYIKEIENYPKPGVSFKDITPLIHDKKAYKFVIDYIAEISSDLNVDFVVGPEARGFIIGCPVAYALNVGFIPIRKPNKLPREVVAKTYELEYGVNEINIHKEDIKPGDRILIVDDVLATGGTVEAAIKLVEELGGIVVGLVFLMELKELNGRKRISNLGDYNIKVLESY